MAVPVTLQALDDRHQLLTMLQSMRRDIDVAHQRIATQEQKSPDVELTSDHLRQIKSALEVGGVAQLDITSLHGVDVQSQQAAPVVSAAGDLPNAELYKPGTLAVVLGPPDVIYYVVEGAPRSWVAAAI